MVPLRQVTPSPGHPPGEAGPGQQVGQEYLQQEGKQEQEPINLNLIHDDLGLLLSKLI